MTTEILPRFDEIERHPDDAVPAYTYFMPMESAMRDLAQELFGLDSCYRLRERFLGEPVPDNLDVMAGRPLPETV